MEVLPFIYETDHRFNQYDQFIFVKVVYFMQDNEGIPLDP